MSSINYARLLASGATLVAIAAIIAGLVAIGPPSLQRDRKLDQRRIDDLSLVSRQVTHYWDNNKKLPPDNAAMANLTGFRLPVDPQTGATYEYLATGEKTFRLCAIFALDTAVDVPSPQFRSNEEWLHGVGHTCFDRRVGKEADGN